MILADMPSIAFQRETFTSIYMQHSATFNKEPSPTIRPNFWQMLKFSQVELHEMSPSQSTICLNNNLFQLDSIIIKNN